MDAREDNAIANLRTVAAALETYRRAYGDWPDSLALLGPAPPGGVSPQAAGLLDAELAAGNKDGYAIRYTIVPAGGNAAADEATKRKHSSWRPHRGNTGSPGGDLSSWTPPGSCVGPISKAAWRTPADPRIGPAEQ